MVEARTCEVGATLPLPKGLVGLRNRKLEDIIYDFFRNSLRGVAEVCTGPGLTLVAQMMFGFGPGSNDSIRCYIEHFGLSRAIRFSQRKSYCS
jgi:hypothetical protein